MAKPTLTPKQNTSTIILPESYDIPDFSQEASSDYQKLIDSFPFGIYSIHGGTPHIATRIGNTILDLHNLEKVGPEKNAL